MNRLDELLLILSEECAEVIQAASKCRRFSMESEHNGQTNRQRLESELGDFMAMLKLVVDEARLNESNIIQAADAKLIKVEKFMHNSKNAPISKLEVPHRRKSRQKSR
jgi:NTP pyrophosphatase (non-canonical NTP hydrolase)